MKKKTLSFSIALALVISISFTLVFYFNYYIVAILEEPMGIEGITDVKMIGLNADKNLEFSKVGLGSTAIKHIIISNDEEFIVKAVLVAEGNISEFTNFAENNVVLAPNENKSIRVSVTPTKTGVFEGVLKVYFKRW